MAQVRKYDNGGKTAPKKRTFTYAGETYDLDAFMNLATKNIDSFILSGNYTARELKMIRESLPLIFKELQSEGLSKNELGAWVNTAGVSSTGERKTNIFGGTKKTEDNAIGLATGLLDYTLKGMTPIKKEEAPAKKEFKIDLKSELGNRYMGGNFDPSLFLKYDIEDATTKKRGNTQRALKIVGVLDDLITQVNSPEFDALYTLPKWAKSKELYLEYLTNAKNEIGNNTWGDLDYLTAAQAGLGGLDEILGITPTEAQAPPKTPEEAEARKAKEEEEEFNAWQKQLEEARNRNYWLIKINPNEYAPVSTKPYTIEDYSTRPTDTNAYYAELLKYVSKDSDYLKSRGLFNKESGYYYIPESTNFKYGSYIRVNPTTGSVDMASLADTEEGKLDLLDYFRSLRAKTPGERNTYAGRLATQKEGGILVAQEGAKTDDEIFRQAILAREKRKRDEYYGLLKSLEARAAKQLELKTSAGKPSRSIADGFEWQDYTRLGAAAADLVSLGAAYAPGPGTIVSGVTGLGSTTANAIADFSDEGVSAGSALSNLGMGLAADVVGLIPGLGSGPKLAKIVKAIKPVSIALGTYFAGAGLVQALDALGKLLKDPSSLTAEDMSLLAGGLKALTSGSATIGRGYKTANRAKISTDPANKTIKTSAGYLKVSNLTEEALASAKTFKEQLEILTKAGAKGTLTPKKTWLGLGSPTDLAVKVQSLDSYLATPWQQAYKSNKGLKNLVEPKAKASVKLNNKVYNPKPKKDKPKKSKDTMDWEMQDVGYEKLGGVIKRFQLGGINTNPGTGVLLDIDRSAILSDMLSKLGNEGYNNAVTTLNLSYEKANAPGASPEAIRAHQLLVMDTKYDPLRLAINNSLIAKARALGMSDLEILTKFGNKNTNWIDAMWGSRSRETHLNTIPATTQSQAVAGKAVGEFRGTPAVVSNIPAESAISKLASTNDANKAIVKNPRTSGSMFLKPEDMIATGRMIGTVMNNKAATRQILGAMKPTLINTYENYVPQTEDYIGKSSAYRLGADLEHTGRRLAESTSDASLGAATRLEAGSRAAQSRLQGDALNSLRIYLTGELQRLESNAAKARRVEVANLNRASMNAVDLAKAQLKASTRLANWSQGVLPFLAGIELNYRQGRLLQDLTAQEQQNLYDLESYYRRASTLDPKAPDFLTKLGDLNLEYKKKALLNKANLGGYTWGFGRRPIAPVAKEGAKLSSSDRVEIARSKEFNKLLASNLKEFMKEVRDSKKMNMDMIRHMSSFTAQLIKAGML